MQHRLRSGEGARARMWRRRAWRHAPPAVTGARAAARRGRRRRGRRPPGRAPRRRRSRRHLRDGTRRVEAHIEPRPGERPAPRPGPARCPSRRDQLPRGAASSPPSPAPTCSTGSPARAGYAASTASAERVDHGVGQRAAPAADASHARVATLEPVDSRPRARSTPRPAWPRARRPARRGASAAPPWPAAPPAWPAAPGPGVAHRRQRLHRGLALGPPQQAGHVARPAGHRVARWPPRPPARLAALSPARQRAGPEGQLGLHPRQVDLDARLVLDHEPRRYRPGPAAWHRSARHGRRHHDPEAVRVVRKLSRRGCPAVRLVRPERRGRRVVAGAAGGAGRLLRGRGCGRPGARFGHEGVLRARVAGRERRTGAGPGRRAAQRRGLGTRPSPWPPAPSPTQRDLYVVEGTGLSTLLAEEAARRQAEGYPVGPDRRGGAPARRPPGRSRARRAARSTSARWTSKGQSRRCWPASICTRWRPWVLVVEAVRPQSNEPSSSAWEEGVLAAGYQLCLFDGLNRFYVAPEHPELAEALSAPASVVDMPYVTYRQQATGGQPPPPARRARRARAGHVEPGRRPRGAGHPLRGAGRRRRWRCDPVAPALPGQPGRRGRAGGRSGRCSDGELDATHQTLSWRVTAPLRRARAGAAGVKRFVVRSRPPPGAAAPRCERSSGGSATYPSCGACAIASAPSFVRPNRWWQSCPAAGRHRWNCCRPRLPPARRSGSADAAPPTRRSTGRLLDRRLAARRRPGR